jgi:hypothetical protein
LTRSVGAAPVELFARLPAMTGATPPVAVPADAGPSGAAGVDAGGVGDDNPAPGGLYGASGPGAGGTIPPPPTPLETAPPLPSKLETASVGDGATGAAPIPCPVANPATPGCA